MTTTPVSKMTPSPAEVPLLGKPGRVWVVVFGLLYVFLHLQFFRRMGTIGLNDGNWSHILVIPFISFYYIYINRERILAQPRRVCLWGLPLLLAGVFGYAMGVMPIRNDMAQGYSIILGLFGLLLLLLGPKMMRILWFPAAFLVFGIKVSPAIWTIVAGKLQFIAARGSVVLINMLSGLTDMHAEIRGSTIDLDYVYQGKAAHEALNVAEACSGLRMLMAFLALGVALAFLFPRRWWQRVAMILLAAPIAILVNTLRVTILALLYMVDPSFAKGQFHIFIGMLMLIPAAGLLMLVGWCLEKLIIGDNTPPTPQPIPHRHDPDRFEVDWAALRRGAAIGAAAMIAVGLGYLFLLNYVTEGILTEKLGVAWPAAANLAGLTAMLLGLGFIAFALHRWIGKAPGGRWFATLGIALGVLTTATVANAVMVNAMEVSLVKKPVGLRYSLTAEFPVEAGDWVLVSQDARLQHDQEDELGTEDYFTRWYLDTRSGLLPEDLQVELVNGRSQVLGYEPGDVVALHIAYYTGLVDTVPHVPDKCWVVAGATNVDRSRHSIALEGDNYRDDPDSDGLLAESAFGHTVRIPTDKIDLIIFSADTASGHRSTAAYFFIANGKYMASNHEVRFGFNFSDRYAYYCKVEMRFPGVNDPAEVERLAQDFLRDMMPQVMAVLPDWTEVQAGRHIDGGGAPQVPAPDAP